MDINTIIWIVVAAVSCVRWHSGSFGIQQGTGVALREVRSHRPFPEREMMKCATGNRPTARTAESYSHDGEQTGLLNYDCGSAASEERVTGISRS